MFQKRFRLLIFLSLLTFFAFSKTADAQMMGISSKSSDSSSIQSQQQEEQEGKKLLDDLGNKTVTCSKLKNADFEKIGEYFMGKALGDTQNHINMNNMMKNMMGEKGEENMHISMGKKLSGCLPNEDFSNTMSYSMMSMMGLGNPATMGNLGALGFGYLGVITWVVVLIDLILLGIWLFKKIQK